MGVIASLGVTTRFLLALLCARHPIHTRTAAIALRPGSDTAEVILRAFADDFPPGTSRPAIDAYLAARFRIITPDGRPIPLRIESVRVEGLAVVTALTGFAPHGLSGHRIWHGVLSERFPDQVNLVQARYGGRSVTLLFTASDSAKPLP